MFNVRKGTATASSAGQKTSRSGGKQQMGSIHYRSGSEQGQPDKGFRMHANYGASLPTATPGQSIGNIPIQQDMDPLLAGFMYHREEKQLVDVYRDIYYYDTVAGSAVDLISILPFSDFSLRGMSDKELDPYVESLSRLNIHTLLPELSVDYQVIGTFIGSLVFDQQKKVFVDIIPQDFKYCDVQTLPFYGADPIIQVDLPKDMVKLLNSNHPRIQQVVQTYGNTIVEKLQSGRLELDPLSTLYIPRRTMTSTAGISYFRRLLPLYFLEKNVYRGTLVESIKRQRAILHVMCGDVDWEPTPEDMQFIGEMFVNADNDPVGSIVTTRNGIQTNEIRQGGDFWKVDDIWSNTVPAKFRALGFSESFLSGEASISTMEANMTGFVENLRSFRAMITRKVFYNKIFPLISLVHENYVNADAKKAADEMRRKAGRNADLATLMYQIQDTRSLKMPTIDWEKHLKPEGDSGYLDMLKTLTEAGVPVPIRMMAAAGGFRIEELMRGLDDDLRIREKFSKFQQKISKLMPQQESEAFASALASVVNDMPPNMQRKFMAEAFGSGRSVTQQGRGKVGLLDRNWGEDGLVYETTATGKKKHVFRQKEANDRINDQIVKVTLGLQKKGKVRK